MLECLEFYIYWMMFKNYQTQRFRVEGNYKSSLRTYQTTSVINNTADLASRIFPPISSAPLD